MKRICVVFGVCWAFGGEVHADVYSALRRVYDSNPVIGQGRSAVDAAHADVKGATTGFQPYLGLVGNAGVARTKIDEYTFDYSPLQYGVEFQQNLFQGGANLASFKAAKGKLVAERANLYATEQEVFLNAINAYIEVLNAKEVLALNQNNKKVLAEYYALVRDRQKVGMLTRTDVAQADARLEMAKYGLVDAQAKYENALETFVRIYGEAEAEYEDIDLEPVGHLFPRTIDDAEEYAMRQHPVLIALEAREKATKQNIVVAYQSLLPSVDVRGAIQQIDDVPYLDDVRDSRVGIYLKVPLYDKGNAFANSDKVRAKVAGIEEQIVNTRRIITENLRIAWNMYDAQGAAVQAAGASVKANQMALNGIKDEQARGRRTVLDVLNAEQELLNSQVAQVRARHARVSAYFSVLSAMGLLTPENLNLGD